MTKREMRPRLVSANANQGMLLDFLQERYGNSLGQHILSVLAAHYLPEALHRYGAAGSVIQDAAHWAIAELDSRSLHTARLLQFTQPSLQEPAAELHSNPPIAETAEITASSPINSPVMLDFSDMQTDYQSYAGERPHA